MAYKIGDTILAKDPLAIINDSVGEITSIGTANGGNKIYTCKFDLGSFLLTEDLFEKIGSTIFTKQELFMAQAPSWNFELDADQLLDKALEVGYVTKVSDDQYLVNNKYKGKDYENI